MDDSLAAVTAAAVYRRRKQRIKNNNQLALVLGLLDEEDAISSEHSSPSQEGKNVKTFWWDHRLQRQNLFMAFNWVPRL